MTVEPEIILLIGGAVVTIGVAIFVIVLLVSARREHDAVLRQEKDERERALRAGSAPASGAPASGTPARGAPVDGAPAGDAHARAPRTDRAGTENDRR